MKYAENTGFSLLNFQIGAGSCTGDSGGPLFFNDRLSNPPHYVQIGIVQGGAGECGDKKFPGLYARLDDYDVLNFIHQTAFGRTIDPPGKNYLKVMIYHYIL